MITTTTRRFLTSFLIFMGSLYRNKRTRRFTLIPILVVGLGFLLLQKTSIPVKWATIADWDDESFWAHP
ncbi:hypothetical protein [uncultured Aquimarina sp.]|uniref:hypothetical protein n=1 Tax=uncultured Aquimarina sp. TaxID=575652 RepID=UPI00261CE835|nr:hypothetical protein [uncultured Aquimarina sp.]